MARFESILPTEVIKQFETLEVNTEKMLGEMVEEGAKVARQNIEAKMPRALREALGSDNIIVSRVYKTPSDDGINCQAMIVGYFVNKNGEKVPAPLVANVFEYGRSNAPFPKQPFFRQSFNKGQIEKAMLSVQEKYIKGENE